MINVQIVQLQPIRVAMLRHVGSYDLLPPQFDKLFEWVERFNIPVKRTIGIYWDNPDEVPTNRLRSGACVELPNGYDVADRGGLPILVDEIPGGSYATARFVGPYEMLASVWQELTAEVEGPLRRKISDRAAFEVYVNDAAETPSQQLITELYMPLQ
jgi:AraC family transcriptional regulator